MPMAGLPQKWVGDSDVGGVNGGWVRSKEESIKFVRKSNIKNKITYYQMSLSKNRQIHEGS